MNEQALLISHHQVGDIAQFQPNLSLVGTPTQTAGAINAKIVAVTFNNGGKVLYDIALDTGAGNGYYEVYPLRSVDSNFLLARR